MATVEVKRRRRSDHADRQSHATAARSGMPAIGIEAEFATVVDGVPRTPEQVFGSPRRFIRGPLVHRTGRSYHLPTGGAVYFDTGVMEIATPMIEIEPGCGARATRSLWESIGFLRGELDVWEDTQQRAVRLVGFSAHYNVSFDVPHDRARSVEQLAFLLAHVLAAPVMLLAANRRSTGIGVRPRGNRVEVTADFTPDAALMAATATLIVGVARAVMEWPTYGLDQLEAHEIPVVRGFGPVPHSSRKGWVAKYSSFPANPFTTDVDDVVWPQRDGSLLSLREMAGRTTRRFWNDIRALADPLSFRLIAGVMRGRAPSLLELDDRPAAYEDVGRLCSWDDLYPLTLLARSRYERVFANVVAGRRVRIAGAWHKPVGVRGWTHVVLRREGDGARQVRSLDDMLEHLDAWDRSADRRFADRRADRPIASGVPVSDERRVVADRREEEVSAAGRRKGDESRTVGQ